MPPRCLHVTTATLAVTHQAEATFKLTVRVAAHSSAGAQQIYK